MILEVKNISKSFGRKRVLSDVSFEMRKGSTCGIVGENGSGKSTLMKIIVGEWKANKGKVVVSGSLGYCPQNILLFPQLTVFENFMYFSKAYGITKAELNLRYLHLLEQFSYKKYANEKVANLSGGTQQKLNLSIALLHQPELLILDEPYNGFDWNTYLMFWDYTKFLIEQGCSILIVTHFLSQNKSLDYIYELKNGQLNEQ